MKHELTSYDRVLLTMLAPVWAKKARALAINDLDSDHALWMDNKWIIQKWQDRYLAKEISNFRKEDPDSVLDTRITLVTKEKQKVYQLHLFEILENEFDSKAWCFGNTHWYEPPFLWCIGSAKKDIMRFLHERLDGTGMKFHASPEKNRMLLGLMCKDDRQIMGLAEQRGIMDRLGPYAEEFIRFYMKSMKSLVKKDALIWLKTIDRIHETVSI